MSVLRELLLVGLGGFGGAIARYGTGLAATRGLGLPAPLGTLAANVFGCLAIGVAVAWIEGRPGDGSAWRLALIVGFLGSYTTFSTFGFETVDLVRDGRAAAALGNVAAQLTLGLGAVVAGRAAAAAVLAP